MHYYFAVAILIYNNNINLQHKYYLYVTMMIYHDKDCGAQPYVSIDLTKQCNLGMTFYRCTGRGWMNGANRNGSVGLW